jgi:hypothetical protein
MGLVLDQPRRSHLRQRRHLRHQGSSAVRGSGVGKEALQGLTSSGFWRCSAVEDDRFVLPVLPGNADHRAPAGPAAGRHGPAQAACGGAADQGDALPRHPGVVGRDVGLLQDVRRRRVQLRAGRRRVLRVPLRAQAGEGRLRRRRGGQRHHRTWGDIARRGRHRARGSSGRTSFQADHHR